MTDIALHTPPSPAPRTATQRPLPMRLAYESERAAVERVLTQDAPMRPLIEDFAREAKRYFPDHKGLELSVDAACEDWLFIDVLVTQGFEAAEEADKQLMSWFIKNCRRVEGRLAYGLRYL